MKPSSDYSRYDDERLIKLIVQLDEKALAQLYDRYSRLVFSLALLIIDDRLTAEEITLDVFMRVWQKAGTYRSDQARVSTWLTHIARHHTIDVLRRRSARPDHYAISWDELFAGVASTEEEPQEFAELSVSRKHIHAALAQLPVDQKQVLILAYFGGYTQLQIAEILNQPIGTIKTRVRLAMQKLRDSLRDENEPMDASTQAQSAYNMTRKEK